MLSQFELAKPDAEAVVACDSVARYRGLVDGKIIKLIGSLPAMFGEETFAGFLYGTADLDEDVLVYFREEDELGATEQEGRVEEEQGLLSRWFTGKAAGTSK